jgi:hypothetical protein
MAGPPNWQDGFDGDERSEDHIARLQSFFDGDLTPADLVDELRRDIELQFALARADTRPHLLSWFSDVSRTLGWVGDPERSGPIGARAVGTEWSWTGRHDKGPTTVSDREGDGEVHDDRFNRTAPSGRLVVVRGFTLMGVEGGLFKVRRYVDWAGVFGQLGLTLNWRTPVTADPGGRQLA